MQSSYNVIKNNRVETNGKKMVDTSYFSNKLSETQLEDINEEVSEKMIESYENLAKSILENARKKGDAMIAKAIEDAHKLEKEAYEKGYAEGRQCGYEDGYREAYDNNIEKALSEAEFIINNANTMLLSAQNQYAEYFEEKKQALIQLSLTMAKHILKKELEKDSGIDNIIFEALSESRSATSCVIRCNGKYVTHLKAQLVSWKERLALKAEIFVVEDNMVEDGNAFIEKDNGRIVVNIEDALDKIQEEILG